MSSSIKNIAKLSAITPNNPVKVAPFGRWTLRDNPSRSALYLQR